MRGAVPAELERGRVRHGQFASDASYGLTGAFFIDVSAAGGRAQELKIIASDGGGWEHVSVSCKRRCPNWAEMCFVKGLFWTEQETVVQYHPPKSEYVNCHPNCLHLWRPTEGEILLPPSIFVGPKSIGPLRALEG